MLIVGVAVLSLVAVVTIVLMTTSKQSDPEDIATQRTDITPTQKAQKDEQLPLSDSDKTTDMEKELESTDVGDIEEDLNSLEIELIAL